MDTGFGSGACEFQKAQNHGSVDIEGIAIVRLCGGMSFTLDTVRRHSRILPGARSHTSRPFPRSR